MIEDETVDRAYEAMCAELSLWQIVGPLEERRTNLPPREFWNAVRVAENDINSAPSKLFHLDSRANAIACVQWHGLAAALAAVKRELAPLPASNDDNLTS